VALMPATQRGGKQQNRVGSGYPIQLGLRHDGT
jgi:hypothetical protein